MRYAVEASGHEVELAAFADHLKGLVVVTAHFDSAADAELFEPQPFRAVGLHYRDFHQVEDAEVIAALDSVAAEGAP